MSVSRHLSILCFLGLSYLGYGEKLIKPQKHTPVSSDKSDLNPDLNVAAQKTFLLELSGSQQ